MIIPTFENRASGFKRISDQGGIRVHDDETLPSDEFLLPDKYWSESDWEKFLIQNEKLMDRYQAVIEENPERKWDDPADLYIKVHHGIDLGHDFPKPSPDMEEFEVDESEESGSVLEDDEPSPMEVLDNSPVYQSALEFSLALTHWAKEHEVPENSPEAQAMSELCFHGLKIAADIAGGIGLGLDEDSLCGNIVKHRWALTHAKETSKRLARLAPSFPDLQSLQTSLADLESALEKQIAEFRTRVWW